MARRKVTDTIKMCGFTQESSVRYERGNTIIKRQVNKFNVNYWVFYDVDKDGNIIKESFLHGIDLERYLMAKYREYFVKPADKEKK